MNAAKVVSLLAVCLFLVSCAQVAPSSPARLSKAEYEQLFADALAKSFAASKDNNVCLPPMFFLPNGALELNQATLEASRSNPTSLAAQLSALEGAGLVEKSQTERMIANKPTAFVRYTRTAKGNQYYSTAGNRFCYGQARLNRVVKWRGPAILGEYQVAWVQYTANPSGVADWAKDPAVLAAFPTMRATVEHPEQLRQALIDLTSEGWEVNEWSRVLQ